MPEMHSIFGSSDVFRHQAFQVAVVEYDHFVEQVPTAISDEALSQDNPEKMINRLHSRFGTTWV